MPPSKSRRCHSPPFANKTVAITGAASPIGLATATLLYDQGASVACSDSNSKALAELGRLLTLSPRYQDQRYMITPINTIDTEQTEAWICSVVKGFGELDYAVNIVTPSQSQGCKATKMKSATDQLDVAIDVALRGISNCMRSQLCAMGQGTAIVNVVSNSIFNVTPTWVPYSTATSHINALTSAAAREYGSLGIRINAISAVTSACSWIGTELLFPGATISTMPLRRAAEPVEVALPIAFLLSDQASYISGTMLRCDGEQGADCQQ